MAEKKKNENQSETLKKVLRYIKHYRWYLILSLLFAVVTVAATLYIPVLTGEAIDHIIDKGLVEFSAVFAILIKIAVIIAMTAVAQWLMNVCNNKITYEVIQDIRREAFEKLQILPLKFIDGHSHGELVSRIIADVDQFADGLLMGFSQLFTGVITILGTLLFMLSINVKITFVVVLITPVSLFVASFIAKRTYTMFHLQSSIRGEQTSLINEMIENQKVVQAFSKEADVLEHFDEINERLGKASLQATFFSSLTNPSTRFVNSLVYTGVGLAGAICAINGMITVGQLSCFLSYANQYTKPFNEISGVITELQNALACAERIFNLIEEEPQVPEASDAAELNNVSGNVELKQVYFSYTSDKKLIEDFNLKVAPGQRVAIVGPTGCGKTTIINLLMRFYDVDSGSILVEGKDIQNVTRRSLRGSYGMVLQETWLKAGTIRENLIMGKPDATEEEMIEAAKAAHAHSFIKRLPHGYDTVIGEEGEVFPQGKNSFCVLQGSCCVCRQC